MSCENPNRIFYYPQYLDTPPHPMCRDGQRRAVSEAWNFLVPGGEKGREETLFRAFKGALALKDGTTTDKHNLISYMVIQALLAGNLEKYVDKEGNYTALTRNGKVAINIFKEIEAGKGFF